MMTTKNLKKIAMALALAGSAAVPLAAQAQAASRGYEVSALAEGRVLVEDPRLAGRRSCDLRFGDQGLQSSKFTDQP